MRGGFYILLAPSTQFFPQNDINTCAKGHRRHSPCRIRSIKLLDRPFGQSLLTGRISIERMFGNLTNFPGGLKLLPHWVRTLFRVEMWVRAKMILYHLWKLQKNHERKSA